MDSAQAGFAKSLPTVQAGRLEQLQSKARTSLGNQGRSYSMSPTKEWRKLKRHHQSKEESYEQTVGN
jgi:hypothetical protein